MAARSGEVSRTRRAELLVKLAIVLASLLILSAALYLGVPAEPMSL